MPANECACVCVVCAPAALLAQLRVSDSGPAFTADVFAGDVPAVAINNALLRKACMHARARGRGRWYDPRMQHFGLLTREFLRPFETYFSMPDKSVGIYDDPAKGMASYDPQVRVLCVCCVCVSMCVCVYVCPVCSCRRRA